MKQYDCRRQPLHRRLFVEKNGLGYRNETKCLSALPRVSIVASIGRFSELLKTDSAEDYGCLLRVDRFDLEVENAAYLVEWPITLSGIIML